MKDSNERNLLGSFDMWAEVAPFLNIVMFFLGWLTVPVEVFLRRDFGARWFNVMNFYAGFLVLGWFTITQQAGSFFRGYYQGEEAEISFVDRLLANSMLLILIAYLILSAFHFFVIWWRNRTFSSLHTLDEGTSWLQFLAAGAMNLVNLLAKPVIGLFMMLILPANERQKVNGMPPLLVDVRAFTDTFFEPFFIFILAIVFWMIGGGITATWLFISAFALAIFANFREQKRMNKWYDMLDSSIEAEITKQNLQDHNDAVRMISENQKMVMQQIVAKMEQTPVVAEEVKKEYPSLMDIIEEVNAPKERVNN